jgi:hypothetical protein
MHPIAQLNIPYENGCLERPPVRPFPPHFGGNAPPNGGDTRRSRQEKLFDGGGGNTPRIFYSEYCNGTPFRHCRNTRACSGCKLLAIGYQPIANSHACFC